MNLGFVPEGDKVHQMIPQRPGAFIVLTEQGRIFELVALMTEQKIAVRQWEVAEWNDETVEAENARVQTEIQRVQMAQHGGGPRPSPRSPIIQPGQVARPGTI